MDGNVDGWNTRRGGNGNGLRTLTRAGAVGEIALGVVHFRMVIRSGVLCLLLQTKTVSLMIPSAVGKGGRRRE